MKVIERDMSVYVGQHKGRWIIDTKHSIDRFIDRGRFPDRAGEEKFKNNVLWVIENAIEKILTTYGDREGSYVVHSESTGIGVVLRWREEGDPRYRDGNNHAVIVTILPIKKVHTASDPRDTLLIVEIKSQIEEFLKENGLYNKNEKLHESSLEVGEGIYSLVEVDELGLSLILYDGSIYDLSEAQEVLVE